MKRGNRVIGFFWCVLHTIWARTSNAHRASKLYISPGPGPDATRTTDIKLLCKFMTFPTLIGFTLLFRVWWCTHHIPLSLSPIFLYETRRRRKESQHLSAIVSPAGIWLLAISIPFLLYLSLSQLDVIKILAKIGIRPSRAHHCATYDTRLGRSR